jgi:hypothetical protein
MPVQTVHGVTLTLPYGCCAPRCTGPANVGRNGGKRNHEQNGPLPSPQRALYSRPGGQNTGSI